MTHEQVMVVAETYAAENLARLPLLTDVYSSLEAIPRVSVFVCCLLALLALLRNSRADVLIRMCRIHPCSPTWVVQVTASALRDYKRAN